MPSLLIVESPTKRKHIQEFLGSAYNVQASVGHIRDLPEHALGVDRERFIPVYEVSDGKKDVVKSLKAAAKSADKVILATDPDREGEAISWHLKEELKLKKGQYERVTFHEITEKAVKNALKEPRDIDDNLVRAQEARRIMDRLCGYLVSGKLTAVCHSKDPLSAGRTQSPALRLIVEREREITGFKPKNHFGARLHFADGWSADFETKPFLKESEEYLLDEHIADAASKVTDVTVVSASEKEAKSAPPAFFTTSSLQQAASASLHMGVKVTSKTAQKLFEDGHITYIRTDNPNISDDFFAVAKAWLSEKGLPTIPKNRTYKAKAGAQEAHEAIRPTDLSVEEIQGTKEEKDLYRLIRLRTIAACMPDAVFTVREAVLTGKIAEGETTYIARGRTLKTPGWKQITAKDAAFSDEEEEAANPVPLLTKGDLLHPQKGEILRKQTKPPSRFDEAGLTRKLEAMGIGRPATYAAIISTIEDRGYVSVDKKRKLVPTKVGEQVCDVLKKSFSFMDYDFTKNMEENLDLISEGKDTYEKEVSLLWDLLEKEVRTMMSDNNMIMDCPHPECSGTVVRYSRKDGSGYFWVCDTCEKQGRKKFYADMDGKPYLEEDIPCPHPDCQGHVVRRKHKDGSGYFWICDTCEQEGRNKFYPDKDGKPGMIEQVDCPNPDCKGHVTRRQRRDKSGYFWICDTCEKEGRNKFYPDKNGKPGMVEQVDCPHPDCQGHVTRHQRKDKSGYFWTCDTCEKEGRKKFYQDKDGKPAYVEEVTDVCPICDGKVVKIVRRDGTACWKCSNCDKYLNDCNGKPELTQKCPSCGKMAVAERTSKKGSVYCKCLACEKCFAREADGSVGQEFAKK